jgi:hypothetical protein
MVKNQYKFGRLKEEKVAKKLRDKGARVQLNEGSKGAEDGIAKWPSGKTWLWQSKATRNGKPKSLTKKEIGRLKQKATKKNATPVIAEVFGDNKIKFKSARNGRELKP